MHPCGNGKIYFLDVCTPATTEKIHFLDVCTLATTEKYIFSMDASLQQRKDVFSMLQTGGRMHLF